MKRIEDFERFLLAIASYENIKEGIEKEIKKDYCFSKELRKAYLSFLSGENAQKAFSSLIQKGEEEGEAFMLIAHSLETGARVQKALLRIAEQLSTKKKIEAEFERKIGLINFTTIASSAIIFPIFCSITIYSFSIISSLDQFIKLIVIFYLIISSAIDGVFQNQKFLPLISLFVFLLSSFILEVVL